MQANETHQNVVYEKSTIVSWRIFCFIHIFHKGKPIIKNREKKYINKIQHCWTSTDDKQWLKNELTRRWWQTQRRSKLFSDRQHEVKSFHAVKAFYTKLLGKQNDSGVRRRKVGHVVVRWQKGWARGFLATAVWEKRLGEDSKIRLKREGKKEM